MRYCYKHYRQSLTSLLEGAKTVGKALPFVLYL